MFLGMLGFNAHLRQQWQEVLQAYGGWEGREPPSGAASPALLAPSASKTSEGSPGARVSPRGEALPWFSVLPSCGFPDLGFFPGCY